MSEKTISEQSTKEEVADFFIKHFKITEDNKNTLLKEDISGDVLYDIDFKSLGVKLGPLKKIQKFLNENKEKFKEIEIKEKITAISKPEEVKNFFENCLNFQKELNNFDGKGLIQLDEEGMKKLGLNLGQTKKLVKYIEYFKTLKVEEPPVGGEEDIIINKESSGEDVAKFLKMRLKFSQDSINSLDLDGESLFMLEETEIDDLAELTDEERNNLKKYLFETKKDNELVITNKSTSSEVAKFLKEKLGFKNESVEKLDLDGESLFLLEEKEIDELEDISSEEKDKLKKFLSEEKNKNEKNSSEPEPEPEIIITKESSEEDVAKYLMKKLNFSVKSVKELSLDGESLFSLNKEDIDGLNEITKEEKDKLKEYLNIKDEKEENASQSQKENEKHPKDSRVKITKETKNEDIVKFFKEKLNLDGEKYDLINESDIQKLFELEKEEKDILLEFLNKEKEKTKSKKEQVNQDDNSPAPLYTNAGDNTQGPSVSNKNKNSTQNKENETDKENDKDKNKIKEKENDKVKDKNKKDGEQDVDKNKVNNKEDDKNKDNNLDNNIKNSQLENIDLNIDENLSEMEHKTQILKSGKDYINNLKEKNKQNNKKNNNKINKQNIEDPLTGKVKEIRVEKEEKISDKKKYYNLKNCKILPMSTDSKYNIFFIFTLQEKYIQYASLATFFEYNVQMFSESFINYDFRLLYERKNYTMKDEAVKIFIIQVPLEKYIKRLNISLKIKFGYKNEYGSYFDIENENENFFYAKSLTYDTDNDFIQINSNTIYNMYFSYFFDKTKKIEKIYQKNLMESLINNTSKSKKLELRVENILRFFKYSLEFNLELKKIDMIEVKEEAKNKRAPLDPEYCLLSEEIEKLQLKNQKQFFIDLIIYIYAHYDKEYLMELINSKNSRDYCRSIFDLLINKAINLSDLSFSNKEDFNKFLINLLHSSNSKDEIDYIIKMISGLTASLKFIRDNCKLICQILEKNAKSYKLEKYNYHLYLNSLNKDDEQIMEIYNTLSNILNMTKDKYYKIIDLDEIFSKMIDFYSNKELHEFCKLNNIVGLLKGNKINSKNIDYYYNKVHNKGMYLIRHNKLLSEEIINFILSQDIYYFNPSYKNNENRDPEIFSYIPITDENKNYKINIKLIKDNDLWNLFADSYFMTKRKFHQVLLSQMKKVKDLKSIFDIFPIKYFDQDFTLLINGKIRELIRTTFNVVENDLEIFYEIYDKWLIINYYNNLELSWVLNRIENNSDLTSKYYFHLLKNNNMGQIVNKIKNLIIAFFLQNHRYHNNAESLVSLLLLCNKELCIYFLNELDNQIMKEKDFYTEEETEKFLLFKVFFKRCRDLIANPEINQGRYLNYSLEIKYKILNDLKKNQVSFDVINNLIDEKNKFYNKILVIVEDPLQKKDNEKEAKNIYNNLKESLEKCKKKFEELELIEEYYNTFFSSSKKELIILLNQKISEYKKKHICEILEADRLIENNDVFNLEEAIEESKNIKYKSSCFFMAIYLKKNGENYETEKNENDIFNESKASYLDTLTRIINQKESKEPFFEINNVKEIMKAIQNKNNDMKKEINFIEKEFENLGKKDYIRKNLLNDLINFSNKDKVSKLLNGIIYFIEAYDKINKIQQTNFLENFKSTYKAITSNGVSGEEIKNAIDLLKKYDYNINYETSLIKFYDLLLGNEKAILFIKEIKDSNLDIRNLNEFIDESENSELQTTDVDNLMDVYRFFMKLMNNKNIKTDEILLKTFRQEFDKNNGIEIKLQGYINTYGEIIQLYESYHENPEMTTQKIISILQESSVKLYKDSKLNLFTFSIKYTNQNGIDKTAEINELEELRNKILMSSTNTNALKKEGEEEDEQNNKVSKEKITKEYITLIDNIKQLNETLNSLLKSGYPKILNLSLKVKNSNAFDKNNSKKNLEKIIEEYNEINESFKKSIKKGYKEFQHLRLFHGQQFINLYEKTKNKEVEISHLINSVSLNRIKNIQIQYDYNNEYNEIENINKYLEKLFQNNNVSLNEIYQKNSVLPDSNLTPGLYRKVKSGDNCDLIINILNIYLNLTDNVPIIDTLLICNEETTIEKIKAFLYRAIFCDKPVLFIMANMECLDLSITQSFIKTLKFLYKYKKRMINSYLLFIYEKVDSGLARDITKLIPEKNLLNDYFFRKYNKKNEIFSKIDLYSGKFSGFGKTTEIIYKVKNKGGKYYYLPIGGSFTRNYVINNLVNLHLDLNDGKNCYLHLDLSDTDNDDLLNEILFNITILRYIESNEKLYYLGNDIHLIIEIPKGYVEFDKKYKLLSLFNKIHIEKLNPLRLEENVQIIRNSPISIVAEVLSLYDDNKIGTTNIDLDSPIQKSANECEKIINKHFQVANQNYYQKMNFIKILSIQFKKFIENPYFNYEIARSLGKENVIKNARVSVIKNFISLTKVFTRSPFDTILLKQTKSIEMFGYDENQAKQEEINDLADDNKKQEIFSFEQIKPSLVFFNRDGGSLSIISNNNKKDKEYKDLKELWNSQNPDPNKIEELVDYKNLEHKDFLEQIKKLFSLDKMDIEDIKKLCEDLGNYIFVSDNFIKMVRILLNIEAKIPVILMGETGVGKTKLLEMLTTLYGKGTCRWKRLQIHAGTTDQKIVDFIEEVNKEIKEEHAENELTWIFLDEINTCNSLGLITEIMCNHTYLGKKISDNYVFLGACNPYRILRKRMRESGLVYYNMKEKSKLNNLVYTVNPLPHALLNFVFDFGSLLEKDEKKYINNTILSIVDKIKREGLLNNINQRDLKNLTDEMIESIAICHNFIREKYDFSSVSLREIRRFGIFFEYFIKYFNDSPSKKMKSSINMTLYLCYYLRLNDKGYRAELAQKLKHFYKGSSFLKIPDNEIKKITKEMSIEKGTGIALNRALRENLFTCFTCIDNKVPLIIIGKPGTGKSLSFQILYNTLKGEYSESEIFKTKGRLYRYYYQGSETSTAEGIEQVFNKASNAQKKNKDRNFITLVFFDEMGLAERSSNNPLKVIHYLLEKDTENSVPFLGISNWRLDAAKINRALSLTITDYDIQDLEETAISIAEALDDKLSNNYKEFFETLAKTYFEYIKHNQNSIKGNKDFHGNRDFYSLIKIAMRELIQKRDELPKNESKILSEIGLLSLNRNFGGLENSNEIIKKKFIEVYGRKFDQNVNIEKFSVLDAIKKNIQDCNSRYLMLISEGNDGSDIVKYLLNSINKKYIELVGSKYKNDIKSGRYSEEILNKIKYIMETDNILILRDLDMIYASLYDLFNQNFTIMGDKKFARIAFEYAKISSEVNKDFHVIVIVNKNKIEDLKLDPPFLNRFEKHIVSFNMLLEEKDIVIAKTIMEYIELISSFNNNEKLKIDLEKLLINCKLHDIEGLIFKIKNDKKDKENEEWIKKDDVEYEKNMIKEVLKKIVPTFCQDIIASMLYSNIDQKYNSIKDDILEIYKNSQYNNFESFFKKIESRKNIIYTLSKSTENLFEEDDKVIKNKFGDFNKQSITMDMIDTPKSENELTYMLKTFTNSKNKKLLIFKVTENNSNKINSVNFLINNFEKEYPKLKEKLILFIVHKQRMQKDVKTKKLILPDYISFINDEYEQIFIDNLQGKENSDVLLLMQKDNEEELIKTYINNGNFIENKIFTILNYIKYTILFETKSLNEKNYTKEIAERIINSDIIKQLIKDNLKKQGKSIKGIINNVFVSDIIDVNDVDFFEVINSKLSTYFFSYLLNIVYLSLKENILNPLLINSHLDIIMKNEYFSGLIQNVFDKTKFRFVPPIKMNINANKVTIYNGLEIPKSKSYIEVIIKYIDERMRHEYIKNEDSLRKKLELEKEQEATKEYHKKVDQYEENIKVEINKIELFKAIYNQNNDELKKMMLNDYLKYFIILYLEKKETNYKLNEKLLNFLKLIIKIKFSENHNQHYDFENKIEEFSKILLFTQGYREDIRNLFDIFIDVEKYFENIEEYINNILDEEIIKYEISDRNKKFTKIVNINLFNLVESIIRSILLYSIELNKKNKVKFFEYFYYLTTLEANLQKMNRKYFLYSKEIYNIRYIIKIEEAYKYNHEQFEKNYESIMNNLLEQSVLLYNGNYNQLYNVIMDLIKIFDESFQEKNDSYVNLLFFIFRQQYKNIYNPDIRIKLVENFIKNELLAKKSKIFLSETLKDFKPEIFLPKKKNQDELIKNFMNLDKNPKLASYKNLINICNNANSSEFNEILLYFFECQCQSYFLSILSKNDNKYTEKCCEKLLLSVSLGYLKKAIQYLYEHKNNNDNNFLKLYAIAYIKTYSYFYVEISHNHFDKVNWEEINRLLTEKDENNKALRNIRNIYIWRLYCKKFDNFELFITSVKDIPIFNDLKEKLQKEIDDTKYIFKESFISPKGIQNYKDLSMIIENKYIKNVKDVNLDFKQVNDNFDVYYSILINKIVSYTYGNDKNNIINIMKNIYDSTYKEIKLGEEGKKLYQYLLNDNLFQNNVVKKISDNALTQDEYEILLYSFRFIFNSQIGNKKCFYNELLRKNANNFINNNYIPGSFPLPNEYLKSYNMLNEKLKQRSNMGYYICKDCGFLYEVKPCTFPMAQDRCPNQHVIGGLDHVCSKKDIRVYYEQRDIDQFHNYWRSYPNWLNSFISTTLVGFKANYVDKNIIKPQKGIIKDYEITEFEKKLPIREINIITFRILNYILYSYLLGSYILNNLTKEQVQNYLVENLFPHTLFGIVKKNWELLEISLRELGIENIKIFMNMIFDKLSESINNLQSVNTENQLYNFEKDINNYIMNIISNKDNIKKLNEDYKEMNNTLVSFNPQSIKEIVLANYEPDIYDQNEYPDIQYYSISSIQDYDTFVNLFNSSKENENKYSLINMLIKRDEDITVNATNMNSLENINKLTNMLLNIYSYKISREDAKDKILKNEMNHIIDNYNQMNPIQLNNEDELMKLYINPFIESWDMIKKKAVQYKCRVLRDLDKGEKPLDMTIDNKLCFFLVDDGDQDGGMFLAAAYQNLIDWQNAFINIIISKNTMNGILNSYVPLLEQEIDIQDAEKEEIINIDNKTYKTLNDLINYSSMRNIFGPDNKIIYKNYNKITYNFDYIEEELGKAILPGIKKFKNNKIRCITYLFEGFRGDSSSVLVEYNTKYPPKQLTDEEKDCLNELLKNNNNSKFYKEVFASLQILMNLIVKENYNQDHLIYKIIEKRPNYVVLDQTLIKFFKDKWEYYMEEKVFTINSLVSIFEYFEALCWKEIKDKILEDYKLDLPDESKKYILNYFEENKDKETIINKVNLTTALRKIISRSLAGTRQEVDISPDSKLELYINKYELWGQEIVENEQFQKEIVLVIKSDIHISHCWALFNLLDGDAILDKELNKNKEEKEKQKQEQEKKEFEIDTSSNQNKEGEEKKDEEKKKDEDNEEEEEEEEEEIEFEG